MMGRCLVPARLVKIAPHGDHGCRKVPVQFGYGGKDARLAKGLSDFKSHLTDAPKGPGRASGTATPVGWHKPTIDSWPCHRQRA